MKTRNLYEAVIAAEALKHEPPRQPQAKPITAAEREKLTEKVNGILAELKAHEMARIDAIIEKGRKRP